MQTEHKPLFNEIRIHINREKYLSPNPTTGIALYELGHIPPGNDLFQEVPGNNEDLLIPRDANEVCLKMDEHFYSEKEFRIIVNGREKIVTKGCLSFAEIIVLAFDPPPSGPDILFTVTYRNGPHENREGILLDGQNIKIKKGMIFNVTPTNKS